MNAKAYKNFKETDNKPCSVSGLVDKAKTDNRKIGIRVTSHKKI